MWNRWISAALIDLGERIREALAELDLTTADPARISLTGQHLYWGSVMEAIAATFAVAIAGSLAVVFVGLVIAAGSLRRAAIALIPNLLPLLAIPATARLAGSDLAETACLVAAIAIGISVDDTIHYLFHYRREAGRGRDTAVRQALEVAGTPIAVTSVLLMAGFAVCLAAELTTVRNTAVYLNVAIGVALLGDLLLVPALLLRTER